MRKGITVPCPCCKKIALRYAKIKGEGEFEMICPHCKELISVMIEQCLDIKCHKK
jgi:uncharacterized protein YbaR (Trm112 family)